MPKANYILTTTSFTMFGESATAHIKTITKDEADQMVDDTTVVIASRQSHENMAQNLFGNRTCNRYADMSTEGATAICIIYRGPPVPDTGVIPEGATITYYLVEVEDYYEAEE